MNHGEERLQIANNEKCFVESNGLANQAESAHLNDDALLLSTAK
jgi:hypothetical protein